MDIANMLISISSLFVGLVVGAVGVYFARRNAHSSSERAEIERQAYLDSLPCQLNVIARLAVIDESPTGGITLQLEIHNDGLGRAFNVGAEVRSTFLRDFDGQRTRRNAQTLNLMRRDPRAALASGSYPPFGFDERLDMPPRLRDIGLKYLEPGQCHSLTDLFFVPWVYLGHPSKYQLKPLEQVLLPGITEEELKEIEEAAVPGMRDDELRNIFEKYRPSRPVYEDLEFSTTRYVRDESLPPGLLLYGSTDSECGAGGKTFLMGPGNGLQLIIDFSHCEGSERRFFALPCPLLILHPERGLEICLLETDSNGVTKDDSRDIRMH